MGVAELFLVWMDAMSDSDARNEVATWGFVMGFDKNALLLETCRMRRTLRNGLLKELTADSMVMMHYRTLLRTL